MGIPSFYEIWSFLKEMSVPAEKAYSDYLIVVVVRLSQKKESIGQLKDVKSIFESVLEVFKMLRRKLIHLSIQRHQNG